MFDYWKDCTICVKWRTPWSSMDTVWTVSMLDHGLLGMGPREYILTRMPGCLLMAPIRTQPLTVRWCRYDIYKQKVQNTYHRKPSHSGGLPAGCRWCWSESSRRQPRCRTASVCWSWSHRATSEIRILLSNLLNYNPFKQFFKSACSLQRHSI